MSAPEGARLPNRLAYAIATFAAIVALILPFALAASGMGVTEAIDEYHAHSFVLFAVLGAVILRKRPGHGIGWLLVLVGGMSSIFTLTSEYVLFGFDRRTGFPSEGEIYLIAGWTWVPAAAGIVIALPLLFPDGRLLSRRWRPLAGAGILATVLASVVDALSVINPVSTELDAAVFLLFGMVMLACLVPPILRFRRSRDIERQQFKWVLIGLAISAPPTAVAPVLSIYGGSAAPTLIPLVVIPVTITVAVLRYRLYDIDVVINRALVYGALTAILGGVYLGAVLLLGLVLNPLSGSSGLSIAASTLAVAALFRPVRARVQVAVDRRFFRQKYDAAQTLAAFGSRLRDQVDLDAVQSDLCVVVEESLQPTHVSLWTPSG